jgi:hydroxypyruvate isomerase
MSATDPTRRQMLQTAAVLAGASVVPAPALAEPLADKTALKGRIKQSLVNWCYEKLFKNLDEMCNAATRLGIRSIELIDPKAWPTLKQHGLTCAIAGSHGFTKGPCDPANWEFCSKILNERLDQCAEAGVPSVITFTGMKSDAVSDPQKGMDNCVEFFKKLMPKAEEKGINVCLEHLNSRDSSHPMKGHPGYMGDHMDYCIELVKRVNSPRMKVLFDIYHVQIMDGDVIRRIHQHKDHIGHIHTAGVPGRGELDDQQEIQYAPIMRALLEIGYTGYVGQEFIPTRDVIAGLEQAVAVCDV